MKPSVQLGTVVALALSAFAAADAIAQRADQRGGDGRVRAPESIPAVERYAPLTTSMFEVVAVRSHDRVVRLKANDGRVSDVRVAEYVYDVSRLKPGDKIRVDFVQPDDRDAQLRAAGVWPAP